MNPLGLSDEQLVETYLALEYLIAMDRANADQIRKHDYIGAAARRVIAQRPVPTDVQ